MKLHNSLPERLRKARRLILQSIVLAIILVTQASWGQAEPERREQIIPILAVTPGELAIGTVVYVMVTFEERINQSELHVTFHAAPGRFSRLAQAAIQTAVLNTARSLNLSPNSWNVVLTVPYPDVIIGGDSLSGMIALTVAALSQGHHVQPHTVLTGTITPNGRIAPVGAVPLKLEAANNANIRRVLVSDMQMETETETETETSPSSMQIAPVRSVREAFENITGHVR